MSYDIRPKPTGMTICDLCDQEITEQHTDGGYEVATLRPNHGGRLRTVTPQHARLWWDPRTWPGSAGRRYSERDVDRNQRPVLESRQYDFHARCILLIVEENLNCYANGDSR